MASTTEDNNVDGTEITYPTARLGAITRKRNEISQVLNAEPPPSISQIQALQQEYLEKINNFEDACSPILLANNGSSQSDEFQKWFIDHNQQATSFNKTITNWIEMRGRKSVIDSQDNVSQARSKRNSKSGRSSACSSSSTLRNKLAEMRASRMADESVSEQKRAFEEAQMKKAIADSKRRAKKIKEEAEKTKEKAEEEAAWEQADIEEKAALERKKQSLDQQRSIRFEENLANELDAIDGGSLVSDINKAKRFSINDIKETTSILKKMNADVPIQHPYFDDCKQSASVQPKMVEQNCDKEPKGNQLMGVLNKQNEISLLLLKNQQKANLPKHEPETFDGLDLTRYNSFIQSFDFMIEEKCDDDFDRICYLEKYTSGLPLQLVKGCRSKDPSAGYKNARQALEREFGNQYRISNAYIKKIENWDSIQSEDGKKLQELSIFLFSCCYLMDNESILNQLNSPTEIMKIVYKLPYKMRDGWRRRVHKIRDKRDIKFKDFCEFVRSESDLVNQPEFGDIADHKEPKSAPKDISFGQHRKKVLATSVKEPTQEGILNECMSCKKTNHQMTDCFFFKKKSREDKIQYLINNKLCFSCFGYGHSSRDCRNRAECRVCGRRHPTAMHIDTNTNEMTKPQAFARNSEENVGESSQTEAESKISTTVSQTGAESKVSMAIKSTPLGDQSGAGIRTVSPAVPVKIRALGSNNTVITYMGLDSFCSDVFMSRDLFKKLGLKGKGRMEDIPLTTMHQIKKSTRTQVVNNLEIYDLDENERALISVVYCQDKWPFTKEDSPNIKDLDEYPFLNDVPFRFIDEEIGLLVGVNQPGLHKVFKTINGPTENGPFATLYRFGWALSGPISSALNGNHHCHRMKIDSTRQIIEEFNELFARDFVDDDKGILAPSIEDKRWEEKVKSSLMKRPDGHFEVGLPFKDDSYKFPSNREQVLSRLTSSRRRFEKNEDFYEEYRRFMDLMLENNFAERVPDDQLKTEPGRAWYLFHFGIYHKQKKKIRIVFDASLRYKGVSLNDTLLQGPDLTSGLLGVLIRFRQEKIGTMADIRKMFYMVYVPIHQRDYLRYFWYPDGDLSRPPMEYRVTVHIFGAVSSPSIANYVLRHSALNQEPGKFSESAKQSILKSFYVDDLVKSMKTEDEASSLLKEIREMLATAGFDLVGFVSNSRSVLDSIPLELLAENLRDLDLLLEELPYQRALGVTWNAEDDLIGFRLNLPEKEKTRRGILSTVFSLYDPLGIVSPVILPAKRLFQRSCHKDLKWDEPLPADLLEEWNIWRESITALSGYQVQRCIKFTHSTRSIQLHFFCDGSETAYAAVAYLRCVHNDHRVCSYLIMAKTRLVPLKGTTAMSTIPRIELNGAKLAILLSQILTNELELKINKTYFWTDSTTVLKYINSETGRFQRFVANRVAFIRNNSEIDCWRYVPSVWNPADIASRGVSTSEFLKNSQWTFGPEFLRHSEDHWPHIQEKETLMKSDPELKKEKMVISTKIETEQPTETLLRSSSSWFGIVRKVAWILRIKEGLKTGVWRRFSIRAEDLRKARTAIFKYVQGMEFSFSIKRLLNHEALLGRDVLIKLNPFLDDDGLVRVGGRINRAVVAHDIRHPIILPKNHYTVQLLVQEIHTDVGHLGRETMLSEIRKTYWILGANSLTRRIVRECVSCRKRQGKPSSQLMADLPQERLVSDLPAFTNIGIDCFGPFLVTRGRARVKRYGVLFTCLASRAVHIEILFTLETDSFINGLRRFASRRGYPAVIRSDNGTNFVGAEKELKDSMEKLNNQHMEKFLLRKNIEWKFHPPAASHFGGVWEREIRTIRKVISGVTNEQPLHLDDEGLSTLMCEVECILNSRPITAISDDPNDLEALTPNHLLLTRSGVTFPSGLFTKDDLYTKRRWRQIQYLADLFWTRWRREFLPLLQERQKWTTNQPSHQIGDLVLVVDQLLPRNQWSLGRIVNVIQDRKGEVRIVDVRVARIKGELRPGFKTTILRRPIVKLIPLKSVSDF